MPHYKILAQAIICLAFLFLPSCHKADDHAPPSAFQIGEDSAPAPELEQGGALAQSTQPKEGDEGPYAYLYEKLSDSGALAEEYAALLTQAENGFVIMDGGGMETAPPDFTQAEGSLSLAKPSVQEGRLFQIDLSWSEGQCALSVSTPEGAISAQPGPADDMTMRDAVEYLQSLPPVRLGLDEGRSMLDYTIFPRLGTVFVNGIACLELDLYQHNMEETHDLVASYLVSGDKRSLFRLDHATGLVDEL